MKIRLEGVSVLYPDAAPLQDVTLELAEGVVTAVLGPSGSGKSTLLRVITGLQEPGRGRVLFDGRDARDLAPEARGAGVVFQGYALFPHLTVRDNIAFGLTTRRAALPADEVRARVIETASWLGLEPLLERFPRQLSGGEQQRVAVARAVAPRPRLLLFDEPLSALDARLRAQLRAELRRLLKFLGSTALYVTHDQQEAMALADRLVVLERGRVVQEGAPLEVYRRPVSAFVASFLGDANLLASSVGPVGSDRGFLTPLGPLRLPPNGYPAGLRGHVALRPEDLLLGASGVEGVVVETVALGASDRTLVRLGSGEELTVDAPGGESPGPGAAIRVRVREGRGHFIPGVPH